MGDLQNRDGLPDSIAEEKRFFPLLSQDKAATPKDWNNPEKWVYLDDISEGDSFGFAIGNGTNYLLIDADHVRNPETGAIVPWVYEVYKRLTQYGTTYSEISMSGSGFHLICDLGDFADNFERESNGYNQIIIDMDPEEYKVLPQKEREKIPKIEFFYHADGRYVFLTGKHKTLYQVATNENAAFIFSELLQIRKEYHEKHGGKQYSDDCGKYVIDDATRGRIMSGLPYISASARETWVHVGMALCNCGFPFEVWDEWSQFADMRAGVLCDKYHADETPKIWKSFRNTKSRWNAGTIIRLAKDGGYKSERTIRPQEFSDVEQAEIFIGEYGERVRFSKATGFLVYTGNVWEENELKAQRLAQELTDRQLGDAKKVLNQARNDADKAAENGDKEGPGRAAVKAAEQYRRDVVKRRSSQRINATLTEAAPSIEVNTKELDKDGFILNTPDGVVDLRTGEIRPSSPKDYCTKITAIGPATEGAETFDTFLNQITCDDADLKRYLQEIAGSFAVGEVKREELFIATGSGGNGKSTFFNLLFRVLGSYAGLLSSDVLITNSRKNKSPELAELRGKRLVLAAELDEGTRLDAAIVKKLASTDPIRAEQKYRDPFDFIPSHSIVLYTNYLPKVGARDSGTWDRLRVIPFNARFRNTQGEVKDYASVLYQECGGAVLAWIVEGAKRYIENRFFIEQPYCVKEAIEEYRYSNDWLTAFIEEKCILGGQYKEAAGSLYRVYRGYCEDMGEFSRSNAEFKQALESIGIDWKKTSAGAVYRGIRTKTYDEVRRAQEAAKIRA